MNVHDSKRSRELALINPWAELLLQVGRVTIAQLFLAMLALGSAGVLGGLAEVT
jgi:hypothetical protein